ncbi:hypothetical protein FQN49_004275, partial [Arthroderma sp. PD_2]
SLAIAGLSPENLALMRKNREKLIAQRTRILEELPKIPGVGRFLGGTDSNFLLVEMLNGPLSEGGKPCNKTALSVYQTLAENKGMVVRFRGKEYGCEGCLRITVGTEDEVSRFLSDLRTVLADILAVSK